MDDDIPFEQAIAENNVARVEFLLRRQWYFLRRVDPNDWTKSNSGSPLFDAASRGHLEIVKALVRAGADIDNMRSPGHSAIHSAASNGHLEVVRFLAQRGASMGVDRDGSTPLDLAEAAGHGDVAEFLRDFRPVFFRKPRFFI